MDNAGIDRCAPQPDYHESGYGYGYFFRGDKQQNYAQGEHSRADKNHLLIAEPVRHETAYKPARGNAYIKERGELRRLFRAYPLHFRKIGARPAHCGGFKRTV